MLNLLDACIFLQCVSFNELLHITAIFLSAEGLLEGGRGGSFFLALLIAFQKSNKTFAS